MILIAIIVAMFSRGGGEAKAIRDLRNNIQALEQKIDGLAAKPSTANPIVPQQNK